MIFPATNVTSERLFSSLRRVKTYLENTMKQVRLNNIMMVHVHKDCTDVLSLIDVASHFIDGSEYRLSLFGNLKETDLKRAQVLVKIKSTQVSF